MADYQVVWNDAGGLEMSRLFIAQDDDTLNYEEACAFADECAEDSPGVCVSVLVASGRDEGEEVYAICNCKEPGW